MRRLKKLILLSLLALQPLALPAIPWLKPDFYYFAQDENLRDLIRNFCLSQGVNVIVSETIENKVSGLFEDISPDVFLNQITKAYGLIWFYDGNVLHVEPFDTIETTLVQVQYYDADRVHKMLKMLGIEGSNFKLKSLEEQGLMLVSGSPRFVGMVSNVIQKLEANEKMRQGRLGVEVFPLKYSWAYDVNVEFRGSTLQVPGLATVLKMLMIGGKLPTVTVEAESKAKMLNQSRQAVKPLTVPQSDKSDGEADTPRPVLAGDGDNSETKDVLIEADKRLNAVIVRDVKENMHLYADLIQTLDKPVDAIQIDAAIVDINVGANLNLGHTFAQSTKGNHSYSIKPSGSDAAKATSGFNFEGQFPAINGSTFLTQVQALESQGNGRVLARPTVLTLDNIQAVLTTQDTEYVSVNGGNNGSGSLFDVPAGTVLQVTPHVISEEEGKRYIKLFVKIEDGSVSGSTIANGLPKTSQKSISTQAVIPEGKSLLVGGFYNQTNSTQRDGVPVLSGIPILGYLFKSTSRTNTYRERLFLITPRIIDVTNDLEYESDYFDPHLEDPGEDFAQFKNRVDDRYYDESEKKPKKRKRDKRVAASNSSLPDGQADRIRW